MVFLNINDNFNYYLNFLLSYSISNYNQKENTNQTYYQCKEHKYFYSTCVWIDFKVL